MSNSTSNVTVTKSGTGFTVDVTACNLLPDLTIKDFNVLVAGTLNSQTNWDKTSQTLLTYTGTALPPSTGVEVRRATPENRVYQPTYGSILSSTLFNEELNRVARRAFEYSINGTGAGAVTTTVAPLNEVYGATWSTDNVRGRTANQLYDKIETLAPLDSPIFTGNPTAPTQTAGDNSTKLATTAFVGQDTIDKLASSPVLGGTPTSGSSPGANDDSTRLATTAFVRRSRQLAYANQTLLQRSVAASTYYSLADFSPSLSVTNQSNFIAAGTNGVITAPPGLYKVSAGGAVRITSGALSNLYWEWRIFNGTNWVAVSPIMWGSVNSGGIMTSFRHEIIANIPTGSQDFLLYLWSGVTATLEIHNINLVCESIREV